MPKAARISVQIPAPSAAASSEQSDSHPLFPIAIFCGIGVLASLIAILMGMPGEWY
jgi:hypothetical protein